MLNFAANISTMFHEYSFIDRIEAAAGHGFRAIECQWPYECTSTDLKQALNEAGVSLQLLNAPAGDLVAGERGLASLAGKETLFKQGMQQALDYARDLDCPRIHVMAGIPHKSTPFEDARALYIDNIRYAAQLCAPHNIDVLIEPINTQDVPGFHMHFYDDGADVLSKVGESNAKLQFDAYHATVMGENIIKMLLKHWGLISHIQISSYPNRHEPCMGDIDYPSFFQLLEKNNYDGWIGCEYSPKASTQEGLGWAKEFGIR